MHVMPVPVVEPDTRGRPEHCLPGAEVQAHAHHAGLQLHDAVVRAAGRQQQQPLRPEGPERQLDVRL